MLLWTLSTQHHSRLYRKPHGKRCSIPTPLDGKKHFLWYGMSSKQVVQCMSIIEVASRDHLTRLSEALLAKRDAHLTGSESEEALRWRMDQGGERGGRDLHRERMVNTTIMSQPFDVMHAKLHFSRVIDDSEVFSTKATAISTDQEADCSAVLLCGRSSAKVAPSPHKAREDGELASAVAVGEGLTEHDLVEGISSFVSTVLFKASTAVLLPQNLPTVNAIVTQGRLAMTFGSDKASPSLSPSKLSPIKGFSRDTPAYEFSKSMGPGAALGTPVKLPTISSDGCEAEAGSTRETI